MIENYSKNPNKILNIFQCIQEDEKIAVHSKLTLSQNKMEMILIHIFRFQDDNPSVNPSGLLVIEVNKTPVITGNITQIADLNINTLSCCKDNPNLKDGL